MLLPGNSSQVGCFGIGPGGFPTDADTYFMANQGAAKQLLLRCSQGLVVGVGVGAGVGGRCP